MTLLKSRFSQLAMGLLTAAFVGATGQATTASAAAPGSMVSGKALIAETVAGAENKVDKVGKRRRGWKRGRGYKRGWKRHRGYHRGYKRHRKYRKYRKFRRYLRRGLRYGYRHHYRRKCHYHRNRYGRRWSHCHRKPWRRHYRRYR